MPLRTANVVGSGPNGLAAAVALAQRGVEVTVYERNAWIGGACATSEITLPGFRHDLGSSCFPMGIASPFFRSLPLEGYGLQWIEPPAAVAHPLDDYAVILEHSIEETASQFEPHDARAWQALVNPSLRDWPELVEDFTRPLLWFPKHPVAIATFGMAAMLPAWTLARSVFQGERARALFAGCAAHSVLPLTKLASSATGLVFLTAGHTTGWPIVAGGSWKLTDALAGHLLSLGGRIELAYEVSSMRDLPPADVTMFDTSARAMGEIAEDVLSASYRSRLRGYRRGPGIFKIDYALSEPIPWRDGDCLRAATVHVGGTLEEIAQSESDASRGRQSERPFVLVVQPSLFDPSRAPRTAEGRQQHTAWAYCHVPEGSNEDRTESIERQIERYAPGFRDVVLARRRWNADSLVTWNTNLVRGDISGGAMTLAQMLSRPTMRTYRTSNEAIYLCSSSTPPGGGVHGMCGYWAAQAALADHGM